MYYLSISLLCIVNDSVREKRREEREQARDGGIEWRGSCVFNCNEPSLLSDFFFSPLLLLLFMTLRASVSSLSLLAAL